MSFKPAFTDTVIPLVAARVAGTYASGPISQPGLANWLEFLIVVTAVGGSTQAIDAVIQTSDDNSSYTSISASAITQLTAVGQARGFGYVAAHEYGQVLVTIGGTVVPTATLTVVAIVL